MNVVDPKAKKPAAAASKGKDTKAKDSKKGNTSSAANLEPEQGKTPPVASYKNPLTKSAWLEASAATDGLAASFKAGIETAESDLKEFEDKEFKHRFVWEQTADKIIKDSEE